MNYLKEDTIAALATAAGKSAIAVVRLSGENSFQIINKVFQTNSKPEQQVKYGYVVDRAEKIDEVLCTFFKAPRTYTGENLVEISVHGNLVIVNMVLNILYKNGARPAEPGEFTYRAFLNGKKDLAEAEAVCALITSRTERSVKAALNNMSGTFSCKVKKINDDITNLLAFMEANLDHPEEDIMFLSRCEKLLRLESYIQDIKNLLNLYKTSKILQKGMKVTIVGKPNVGKSSLLNVILGKNRAIVTDIAGTTTDSIEETIDYHGIPIAITDTAGIRNHTENIIELLGQKQTKETINIADILVWVFDISSELDQNDMKIASLLKELDLHIPIIGVLNKSDLTSKLLVNDIGAILTYPFHAFIEISTKTGTGISNLLNETAKIAEVSDFQNDKLMINSRHFTLLQNALDALVRTKQVLTAGDSDEIACFEASAAQTSLNEILGINVKQDIIDAIFSTFCIGK
ncbi:MAG: tRNA uridine-5-carboxymethylaminomethyl(34) synthesis GTPase MnmE [Endomicrobium sp.]|jgi:tRNA modification GTPase|nr:tRNA uridine-5-carboxymethylaminomethyl(34) synthesis GTPase MnmE [Endomicrobium sp.]